MRLKESLCFRLDLKTVLRSLPIDLSVYGDCYNYVPFNSFVISKNTTLDKLK